jgi:MFS family permease
MTGQLGMALLVMCLGALGSMRFTGDVVDRYGDVVLAVSMAPFGSCGLLLAFLTSAGTPDAARFLLGVTSGATGSARPSPAAPPDVAISVAARTPESVTGRSAMKLAQGFFSGAVVVAASVLPACAQRVGVRRRCSAWCSMLIAWV